MSSDALKIPFAVLLRIVSDMDGAAGELLRSHAENGSEWNTALELEDDDLPDVSFATLLSVTFEIDQLVAVLLAFHAEGLEQLAASGKIFNEQSLFVLCKWCNEPIMMPGDPHDECNRLIADQEKGDS